MKIYFAKTKKEAILPSKRIEDAGFDLFACFEGDFLRLNPFEVKLIPTGIACAFEDGEDKLKKECRHYRQWISRRDNGGTL